MEPRDNGDSTRANDEMDVSTGTFAVIDPDAMDSKMSCRMKLESRFVKLV